MINYVAEYKYIQSNNAKLFTVILLPESVWRGPVVAIRSPYVDIYEAADDIKGAIFGVQDCERYNICYRNGFLKKGLHGGCWRWMKDIVCDTLSREQRIYSNSFLKYTKLLLFCFRYAFIFLY